MLTLWVGSQFLQGGWPCQVLKEALSLFLWWPQVLYVFEFLSAFLSQWKGSKVLLGGWLSKFTRATTTLLVTCWMCLAKHRSQVAAHFVIKRRNVRLKPDSDCNHDLCPSALCSLYIILPERMLCAFEVFLIAHDSFASLWQYAEKLLKGWSLWIYALHYQSYRAITSQQISLNKNITALLTVSQVLQVSLSTPLPSLPPGALSYLLSCTHANHRARPVQHLGPRP